jgi:hypothetical protein
VAARAANAPAAPAHHVAAQKKAAHVAALAQGEPAVLAAWAAELAPPASAPAHPEAAPAAELPAPAETIQASRGQRAGSISRKFMSILQLSALFNEHKLLN